MPRLDPAALVELVLDCDRDKPNPPTFHARTMSARQWLVFAEEYSALFAYETTTQQTKQALALLEKYIVGWGNFPGEFDANALGDELVAEEIVDLLGHLYRKSRLSYEEKKTSASSPSSNPGSSAATAAAESAPTPPAS